MLVGPSRVHAIPLVPHTFFGEVFDGTDPDTATAAASGLKLEARFEGVNYANSFDTGRNTNTAGGGTFGQDNNFHACGDTTDIAGRQGFNLNEPVELVVGGRPVVARDAYGAVVDPVLFVSGATTFLRLYRDLSATVPTATASSDACKIGTELPPPPPPPPPGQIPPPAQPQPPPPFFEDVTPTPTPLPAADVLEKLDKEDVASFFTEASTDEVAKILEELDVEFAGEVFEELDVEVAAAVLEQTNTTTAARVVEEIAANIAADILESVTTTAAAAIVEQVQTSVLELIIDEMEEAPLTEILQEVSVEKLQQISVQVLLDNLTLVNPEVYLAELPPAIDPDSLPPEVVVIGNVLAYTSPTTGVDFFVILVSSPAPLERILGKFRSSLTNVRTTVQDIAFDQDLFDQNFPGQVFNSSFSINIENVDPGDVAAAHVTMFVEKSWLQANNVQKWSVQFNRFDEPSSTW